MTTDQEAENVAASVRHLLIQRGIDAREWERQAKQWQAVADRLRAQRDELLLALSAANRECGVLMGERDELQRQLAELSHIIGTETPIAALTLAETWQAEKAHYMEAIAELRWRARAVYRYVQTYETTRDGDEARMAVGEELWAAGATDPDRLGGKEATHVDNI